MKKLLYYNCLTPEPLGEPESRTEARLLKEGIPLPPNAVKELTTLGESLGVPFHITG